MRSKGNVKHFTEGERLPEVMSHYEDPAFTKAILKQNAHGAIHFFYDDARKEAQNSIELLDEDGDVVGVLRYYDGDAHLGMEGDHVKGQVCYSTLNLSREELRFLVGVLKEYCDCDVPSDIKEVI